MKDSRLAIKEGRFKEFKEKFITRYENKNKLFVIFMKIKIKKIYYL